MAKDKSPKADKKAKKGGEPEALPSASIKGHPRARAGIRRARSRAAFGVFLIVLLFGLKAGLSPFDATWRALVGGLVANLVAWRCAIVFWKHLVVAELRAAEDAYAERRRAAIEAAQARAGEQATPGFRAA